MTFFKSSHSSFVSFDIKLVHIIIIQIIFSIINHDDFTNSDESLLIREIYCYLIRKANTKTEKYTSSHFRSVIFNK